MKRVWKCDEQEKWTGRQRRGLLFHFEVFESVFFFLITCETIKLRSESAIAASFLSRT